MEVFKDDVLDDDTLACALSSAVSAFLQPIDDEGGNDDASQLPEDNPEKLRCAVPSRYVDTALTQHKARGATPNAQRNQDNEARDLNLSKELYGNQAANEGTLADLLYRHERYAGSQEDNKSRVLFGGEHEDMPSDKEPYSINAQSTSLVLSASDGSVVRTAHGDYWNNWDSFYWSWFSNGFYNNWYSWGDWSVTSSLHYQNLQESIGSNLNYWNSSEMLTLELAEQVRSPTTFFTKQHRFKIDKKKKSRQSAVPEFGPSVTTIMVRNIPNRYTIEELLDELVSRNFARTFNFFYLPMDFSNKVNMGYCFINFLTSHLVELFYQQFHGAQLPKYTKTKIIEICPASTQGYMENVNKFLKGAARIENEFFRPLIFQTRFEQDWYPIPLTKDNLTIGITEQATA